MQQKVLSLNNIQGLSSPQIFLLQREYGKNIFIGQTRRRFISIVWDIVKEPMFLLLLVACSMYFILGEVGEGIMMFVAMSIVSAISLYQTTKSSHALDALKQLTDPKITVIRDGEEIIIPTEELVPGDIVLLSEGMNIPADAIILQGNDLTVNESILTGESLPVEKYPIGEHNILYQGTTINSGKCVTRITATGNNTVLGKLGKSVTTYHPPKTLLQLQINLFVRRLAIFGLIGFLIIFFVNYANDRGWAYSLLVALTLAMSAIPEEIPVAFSSFMALGAYQMSKLGIISRQSQVIESLGAVSVICLDKTGTITQNKMQVKTVYQYDNDLLIELDAGKNLLNENILYYGMLASEQDPFDEMEKAILKAYYECAGGKGRQPLKMVHEYPLEGQPPMMTHVYRYNNAHVVAAKGAPERILNVCRMKDEDKNKVSQHIKSLASKGYRVIGIASAMHEEPFPTGQDDFNWKFEGLLALYDPPKTNMQAVLRHFYDAGIEVKLLTGDYAETAINIAGQVGIHYPFACIMGEQVMQMDREELKQAAKINHVFARMFPDAKLKVIRALKESGEIVAMTGDGVNDAPALRASDIGIAMGQKGTEMARQASGLILTDDNLERMTIAIREGRKIFSNFKKAIRYIISIHIPIILIASLPVLLGWAYPNIFTPIHVIFLELIMGPTCSIFFEKEPSEEGIMQQHPRERKSGLFTREEFLISITQGVIIAAGSMILYYYFMNTGASLEQTRAIVFTSLILSNTFLTFTNRSFTQTIYYTSRHKNKLAIFILIIPAGFLAMLHFVPAIRNLFQLGPITIVQFLLCFTVSLASTMWFEIYKTGLDTIKRK